MRIQNNNKQSFGYGSITVGNLSRLSPKTNNLVARATAKMASEGNNNINIKIGAISDYLPSQKGLYIQATQARQKQIEIVGGRHIASLPGGMALGYPRTEKGVIKLIENAVKDLKAITAANDGLQRIRV